MALTHKLDNFSNYHQVIDKTRSQVSNCSTLVRLLNFDLSALQAVNYNRKRIVTLDIHSFLVLLQQFDFISQHLSTLHS